MTKQASPDPSHKVLLFGGVYSNYQALQALQKVAQTHQIPPSNIFCTGDIVAYCAQPAECLQLIQAWGVDSIVGNVEIQLRTGADDCGCNFDDSSRCDLFSRQWYPYARSKVSQSHIDWLHTLPDYLQFTYGQHHFTLLHGSYFNVSEYIFKSTDWSIKAANFEACQTDVIVAGHCGLPFYDHHPTSGKLWLNAGVIGMPANDSTPRVWYTLLHPTPEGLSYTIQSLTYDHHTAAELMRTAQLPCAYADTLSSGLWDNCDILPAEETARQGLRLPIIYQ